MLNKLNSKYFIEMKSGFVFRLPHKRPMTTRRGGPHSIKRPKLDVSSSTDTSGRDTTSSTTTTTTTTSDTSHDDGPGGSGASGDRSRSASGGERPHDRSSDKEDRKRKRPRDADQPGTSGLGSKAAGEPVRDAKGSMSEASRDMSAEQDGTIWMTFLKELYLVMQM